MLNTGFLGSVDDATVSDHGSEVMLEGAIPSPGQMTRSTPRSSARAQNDWTMHLFDPTHTSFTSAIGPTNSSVLWYNTTGDTTYSSPCVADGRVFLGVGDSMKCYYENNGTLAWTMYPDNNVAGGFGVCSSPAYANGSIYFGADKLYCVWATNGTIRWKVNKPNIKHGDGTPTLANGKVFIAGSDHKLYCIDQLTGSVQWTFQAKSDYPPAIPDNWGLYAAPAVVNGSVYLAACDWNLYQINVTQPTSVATANNTFKMGWASYSSPLVVGDKVYVGCSYIAVKTTARFYCLWASNLTTIWEFYPGSATGFLSSAGYFNDRIFVGSVDGNLYCLNATNGSLVWKYDIGGTWSSPAVTSERLYIGSKTGYIYCFNTTQPGTPDYYWRYSISGEVDTSPSVVPGRVYIGTHGNNGRLYCFGTADLQLPQVLSTHPPASSTDIPITTDIRVTFSEPMNPNSITSASFSVSDSSANPVAGDISYNPTTNTSSFSPASDLNRGEDYTVTISNSVTDHWANPLDGNKNNQSDSPSVDKHTWSFWTLANAPPSLTKPTVTPSSGGSSTEFEFSVVYTDADNDTPAAWSGYIRVIIDGALPGSALSLNSSASAPLRDGNYTNGEEYVYSTTISSYGLHNYTFVCNDGNDTNETPVFNNPLVSAEPTLDPLSDLDAVEDVDLVLSLVDKLHDEDTSLSELIITVNSSYATVEELNVTFNYPNEFNYPSGRDHELVAINVTDGRHNITRVLMVNVTAVNDAPTVADVPDINCHEGEKYYFNVGPYLSDPDNEVDELTVTLNSNFATVSDKNITLFYPNGSEIVTDELTLEVFDGELYGSQDLIVTVNSGESHSRFELLPIPDQNAVEDIDLILDLAGLITFTGQPFLEDLTVETNSSYCTISGLELTFNYPNSFNYPSGCASEFVSLSVFDREQTENLNFTINVQAVNDVPVLTALHAPSVGLADTGLRFSVEYLDIDGGESPLVQLALAGSDHYLNQTSGDIHTSGGTFETELSLRAGEYEYHFVCDDGQAENNSVVSSQSYRLQITEFISSSNDTDGDNIPDLWELHYGLDPNNSSDAAANPDGDNYTNLEEFLGADGLAGGLDSTDPFDSSDHPLADQEGSDDDMDSGSISSSDNRLLLIGLGFGIITVIIFMLIIIYLFLKQGNIAAAPELEGLDVDVISHTELQPSPGAAPPPAPRAISRPVDEKM